MTNKELTDKISNVFVCDKIDTELCNAVRGSIYDYNKTQPIFNYMNAIFSNMHDILKDGYEI